MRAAAAALHADGSRDGAHQLVDALAKTPVWAFHGDADGVVPLRYRVAFLNVGSFFWNSWLIFRFEREEAKRAGASSADPVLAPPTVAATQCNVEGR